jgi:hypothetical protein
VLPGEPNADAARLDNLGMLSVLRRRFNTDYQMFVLEPNGYLVEFQRFYDQRWLR